MGQFGAEVGVDFELELAEDELVELEFFPEMFLEVDILLFLGKKLSAELVVFLLVVLCIFIFDSELFVELLNVESEGLDFILLCQVFVPEGLNIVS